LLTKNPFCCRKEFWINLTLTSGDYKNSPAAQTIVIADLTLCQDLLAKTLSIASQMDIFWATDCYFQLWLQGMIHLLHIKLIYSTNKSIENELRICC